MVMLRSLMTVDSGHGSSVVVAGNVGMTMLRSVEQTSMVSTKVSVSVAVLIVGTTRVMVVEDTAV